MSLRQINYQLEAAVVRTNVTVLSVELFTSRVVAASVPKFVVAKPE